MTPRYSTGGMIPPVCHHGNIGLRACDHESSRSHMIGFGGSGWKFDPAYKEEMVRPFSFVSRHCLDLSTCEV